MKRYIYILVGIAIGILGVFIYQVYGKPAMPKVMHAYEYKAIKDQYRRAIGSIS